MQRRYQAVLWKRNPKDGSHVAHVIGTYRSPERAERAVHKRLDRHHRVYATRYSWHRDERRAAGGEVCDLKVLDSRGNPKELRTIEPHMYEVQSVGDLGWTP